MGVSTAKQYLAAVALLQRFQHTLLHGDLVGVPITRAACVKLTLSHVRKHENTRRQTSMVDAAASECPWFKKMMTGSVHGRHLSYILYNACLTLSVEHMCFFFPKIHSIHSVVSLLSNACLLLADAPTLIEESQHMSLLESHLVKDNKRAYVAGMRDVAMHNHAMSTMGRSDEGRQKKVCSQVLLNYPIPEDDLAYNGSKQLLQTTIFSMSAGKTNDGESKDYQAAARHSNVSILGFTWLITNP